MTTRSRRTILGFTMIELLVATTILALLSAIGIISFTTANQRARDAKRKADLTQVQSALELYRSQVGSYPAGNFATMVSTLNTAQYINVPSLTDPKNGQTADGCTFGYVYSLAGSTYTLGTLFEIANQQNMSCTSCNNKYCTISSP